VRLCGPFFILFSSARVLPICISILRDTVCLACVCWEGVVTVTVVCRWKITFLIIYYKTNSRDRFHFDGNDYNIVIVTNFRSKPADLYTQEAYDITPSPFNFEPLVTITYIYIAFFSQQLFSFQYYFINSVYIGLV